MSTVGEMGTFITGTEGWRLSNSKLPWMREVSLFSALIRDETGTYTVGNYNFEHPTSIRSGVLPKRTQLPSRREFL